MTNMHLLGDVWRRKVYKDTFLSTIGGTTPTLVTEAIASVIVVVEMRILIKPLGAEAILSITGLAGTA